MAKIEESAAEEILAEWCEHFDVELDPGEQSKLSRTIQRGRIDFDDEAEVFTLHLAKPVELQNGDTLRQIEIHDVDTGQLMGVVDIKGVGQQNIKMLSAASGQPEGVLNRMAMRDFNVAGVLLSFFA